MEKQKEYNLRYLLAKVRTTCGKSSDRFRQRAKKRNKNRVGRLPTSEQNRKIILSDEDRRRNGKSEKSEKFIITIRRRKRRRNTATSEWLLLLPFLKSRLYL
jgi:hypothetical protein